MRCVVLTVICYIWAFRPDISDFIQLALYSHIVWGDQSVTNVLKLVRTANQTQDCRGTSSPTECAVFNLSTHRPMVYVCEELNLQVLISTHRRSGIRKYILVNN